MEACYVDLTAEDIAKGEPRHPCHCPLANAFTREHPDAGVYINAQGLDIHYADGRDYTEIPVTEEAIAIMDKFDAGEPVLPGRIKLFDAFPED